MARVGRRLHPGRVLREEYMAPLRLDPAALAHAIGVPADQIESVLDDVKPLRGRARCGGCLVASGPIDGAAFRDYIEQFLALAPGGVVVADNLGSHKVAGVREAIEARGASPVFLLGYNSDLNPI